MITAQVPFIMAEALLNDDDIASVLAAFKQKEPEEAIMSLPPNERSKRGVIHGGARRKYIRLPEKILHMLHALCRRFLSANECLDETKELVQGHFQIMTSLPGHKGQSYHMDCFQKGIAITVLLNEQTGTQFSTIPYVDVEMADHGQLPDRWSQYGHDLSVYKAGTAFCFWTNSIHRAPPNEEEYDRVVLYGSFGIGRYVDSEDTVMESRYFERELENHRKIPSSWAKVLKKDERKDTGKQEASNRKHQGQGDSQNRESSRSRGHDSRALSDREAHDRGATRKREPSRSKARENRASRERDAQRRRR